MKMTQTLISNICNEIKQKRYSEDISSLCTKLNNIMNNLSSERKPLFIDDLNILFNIIEIGLKINVLECDEFFYHFTKLIRFDNMKVNTKDEISSFNSIVDKGLSIDGCDNWRILLIIDKMIITLPHLKKVLRNHPNIAYFWKVIQPTNFPQMFYYLKIILHNTHLTQEILGRDFKVESEKNISILEAIQKKSKLNSRDDVSNHFFKILKIVANKNKPIIESSAAQYINNHLYIWTQKNEFIEIHRSKFEISKTLKNQIKLVFLKSNDNNENIVYYFEGTQPFKIKGLSLTIDTTFDTFLTDKVFNWMEIKPYRVSESTRYLTLTTTEETSVADNSSLSTEGVDLNTISSIPELSPYCLQLKIPRNESVKNVSQQLATPDQTDSSGKINVDNNSSNVITEYVKDKVKKNNNNKEFVQETNDDPINGIEIPSQSSPSILVQKRKMIRETTRTREILEKQFELENSNPPPSLMITKYKDIATLEGEPGKNNNSKINKSIGINDLSILNTLFNTNDKKKDNNIHNKKTVLKGLKNTDLKYKSTTNSSIKPKLNLAKRVTKKKTPIKKGQFQAVKSSFSNKQQGNIKNFKSISNEMFGKKTFDKNENKIGTENQQYNEKSLKELPTVIEKPVKKENQIENNISQSPPGNPTIIDEEIINESTTIANINNSNNFESRKTIMGNNPSSHLFTNQLQEQIFASVTNFSNDLIRKVEIINGELNKKILTELSVKYQNLITQLQRDFQYDSEQMINFFNEIKTMLNLPEEELIEMIRNRHIQ